MPAWRPGYVGVPYKQRQQILRQHKGICHVCHQPGATHVDHVTAEADGGTSDPANLRPIHPEPCHREKTARERAAGRARNPAPTQRRTAERHPGLL
jgi:5-methylcytosine-specific restriction endonuclease McrA